MLTRLHIKNFKRFDEADVELGRAVVLIGPNNSGKTSVLQAIALWDVGLRRWNEKRQGRGTPEKRPGVTINRRDLLSIPAPSANLLWRALHVRDVTQVEDNGKRRPKTQNVTIDVVVDGVGNGQTWTCGLEFDYANEESFYCRPLRMDDGEHAQRMTVPPEAARVQVAFLPPMSGLAGVEPLLQPGRANVLLGEGQTAQVLRNLCFWIYDDPATRTHWDALVSQIERLFGVELLPPEYVEERGEITMAYRERGAKFDLSSSGRGLQQTLLLLAHLYKNPGCVLLLDEPDAHLEVLRQRQTYQLLTEVASSQGSQLIAASHSEIVMNEAAERDLVIAFVGRPHRIANRGAQVLKALRDIGFDQYYQAEQTGWVLYLEGSTDLEILRTLAERLGHPAARALERPFVHYVGTNLPQSARDHFYGLREAKPDLVGVALFDRLDRELRVGEALIELMWTRRELENYICLERVLIRYAEGDEPDDLFSVPQRDRRVNIMRAAIGEVEQALKILNKPGPWSADVKVTDDFLDPLFERYFRELSLPVSLRKSEYYRLARLMRREEIDPEVPQVLDRIAELAGRAVPMAS